jgi:hypothetical protein
VTLYHNRFFRIISVFKPDIAGRDMEKVMKPEVLINTNCQGKFDLEI